MAGEGIVDAAAVRAREAPMMLQNQGDCRGLQSLARGLVAAAAALVIAALAGLFLLGRASAESCIASVYSTHDAMQSGARTASGIPLNDGAMTAAHRSLPFRSHARVTSTRTGRSITVMITDRGPYWPRRCIDLTRAAARAIGVDGTGPVTVERE
jgi:rare lipoprotein A